MIPKDIDILVRRFIVHLWSAHALARLPFLRSGARSSCLFDSVQYFHGLLFCILIFVICYLSFLPFPLRAFCYLSSLWFDACACACIYLGRFNRLLHIWRCQYEYLVVLSGRQPDKCHMSTWNGNVHWHSLNSCDAIEMVWTVGAPIFDV